MGNDAGMQDSWLFHSFVSPYILQMYPKLVGIVKQNWEDIFHER